MNNNLIRFIIRFIGVTLVLKFIPFSFLPMTLAILGMLLFSLADPIVDSLWGD